MMRLSSAVTRYGPEYTPFTVSRVMSCTAAIVRLDARISASSVAAAWSQRAAWTGYAQALQLQGVEIDEIDVFSWGCTLRMPDRPILATNVGHLDPFETWDEALRNKDPLAWCGVLPSAEEPQGANQHPPLIRAFEHIRQQARLDTSIRPWLSLPFAFYGQRLTMVPLPCLTGGSKALRVKRHPAESDWLAALRAIETAADKGLSRLERLEAIYRDAQRSIEREYRPGALPLLLALSCHRPVLSPQFVAATLDLSVSGASKLLQRAVSTGLLVEVTKRRTWRVFLAADLAVEFGYVRPRRGRPRADASPVPFTQDLATVYSAFDEDMLAIERLLGRVTQHTS